MGATVGDDGVTFRVWAPSASAVAVTGDFNDWSTDAAALAQDGDGYWSALVDAAAGDEYRFVLHTSDGEELSRIDPYAREVTSSVGNAVVRTSEYPWTDDGFRRPSLDELVVYELHAGTFDDEPGGAPGSFANVVERLDHLVELGVNAIELMPAAEFAADFSWGYNPSHVFAVEQAYGGPDELKRLVDACHGRGIAVLLDVVYNHFGPSDLDLWRFDGWHDGKGGIYFYNDHRASTPWGDTRPDYGRREVRAFLLDNVRWWLDEYHMDGLRLDMTAFVRTVEGHDGGEDLPDGWSLLQQVAGEVAARGDGRVLVAEDLQDNPWLTKDTGAGGAGFDTQWAAAFVHPVRAMVTAQDDEARDMRALAAAIQHRYGDDPFARVVYSESHDEVANGKARLPEEIWPGDAGSWYSRKRSTLAAALVLCVPGVPMLFQGQEVLEDAWFRDDDPVDWSRAETYPGVLAVYRDLVRLRRDLDGHTRGLRGGNVVVHHVNDTAKVVAFHRWDAGGVGDDVVVVVNCSTDAFAAYRVGLPRPGVWRVRCNTDWSGYGDDYGAVETTDVEATEPGADGMAWAAELAIGPYTAVVLSQDPT